MPRSLKLLLPVCLLLVLAGVLYRPSKAPLAATPNIVAVSALVPLPVNATAAPSPIAGVPDSASDLAGPRISSSADRLPLRLANTDVPFEQLYQQDDAILLANALFDTRRPLELTIPAHLRNDVEPAAYVIQARGPITDAFRAALSGAGAQFVSFIPNNACLVRASAGIAQALRANPLTQAVLPWEPYFKLSGPLLKEAVTNPALTAGGALALTLFADLQEPTLAAVRQFGADVLGTDKSPFGPVAIVRAPPGTLAELARLPGVQAIEEALPRVAANDVSRVRLSVAADTGVATNYLGLTGTNVMVAVVDTGVDATHPDLAGRVFGPATNDVLGHGTHVAGIIASSGDNGPNGTNVSGSVDGASFRGLAPAARIYTLAPAGIVPAQTDAQYQEEAARTNAFISNNSWSYNASEYTIGAANYDAAVRDALPRVSGSQPAIYVFPSGNSGAGNNTGGGGAPGSVLSPGTAKNVITVGAIEQMRNITNKVVIRGQTNAIFFPRTDSSVDIAAYSGRGNVGIFLEGPYGRFKPDVVAPGNFVVSCRSAQWDTNAYYHPTNHTYNTFADQSFNTNQARNYSLFVPANAVGLYIWLSSNDDTPTPQPDLPIFVRKDGIPNPGAGTYDVVVTNWFNSPSNSVLAPVASTWFYTILNATTGSISINVNTEVLTTNDLGDTMEVLRKMNNDMAAPYRYESGTSMAAAKVSGFLALLQEYFEQQLHLTNSPALMKAFLINGARSLGQPYSFETQTSVNYQGWGLPNLPTTLPAGLATNLATRGTLVFFDQNPTNALATGEAHTRTLKLDDFAAGEPLRFTLVWTDPPGNPAASLKLVNNLDLIVTNLDSGEVFYGNDILADSDFNFPWNTNAPPLLDSVNNVENIYLAPPLGTNYTVTVQARRINVNALPANTNSTVQDYALVISAGDGTTTNGFSLTALQPTVATNPAANVTYISAASNGVPLLRQLAGASAPLSNTNLLTNAVPYGSLNVGATNQWAFYVVTNGTSYTNAAFLTFLPPTLSLQRMGVQSPSATQSRKEADIDMYVSRDPQLTNLAPAAVTAADKALTRLGTELIVYSNSAPGYVYYIGVKCESQMAAEYGFVALFSEEPFGAMGDDGITLQGVPLPALIPDGSPQAPGGVQVFAINALPAIVRRAVVYFSGYSENWGDLLGNLALRQTSVVLNNHTEGNGQPAQSITYDDSGENDIPDAQPPTGPGSLRSFSGEEGVGPWIFTMVDNSLVHTGAVTGLKIVVEPVPEEGDLFYADIQPRSWYFFPVNVPADATNLTVTIAGNTQPLELYMRRGSFPTQTLFGRRADILPPGGSLSWSIYDNPPLTAGRYFVGIYNPNGTVQTVSIQYVIERDTGGRPPRLVTSREVVPIVDDAVTYASLWVTNLDRLVSVEAGIRLDHPRVSDLALTLISPRGTRVLLSENRGYASTNGFGTDMVTTNVLPVDSGGGFEAYTNIVDTGRTTGTFSLSWDFYWVPDQLRVYYDGQLLFDTGFTNGTGFTNLSYGPGNSELLVITVNEGDNPDTGTLWEYELTSTRREAAYAIFTENTNRTLTPIKFAVPPFAPPITNQLIAGENFDAVTAGIYDPDAVVGIWLVASNAVEVIADAAFANSPPNYLRLGHGALKTTIATQPGQNYTVTFVSRLGPSLPINGSFEAPPGGSGAAFVHPAGSVFGGWNVLAGEVKHLGGASWVAAEGSSLVDLNGQTAANLTGTIYRDIATVAAQPYQLRFAYAGNPAGAPVVKDLAASWNLGAPLLLSFDATGHTPNNLGWTYTNVTVTGTGNDRLDFASRVANSTFGPLVDAVTLTLLGAADVYAGGRWLGTATGGTEWQTNAYEFTAATRVTELEIASAADGLMLDSVQVTTLAKAVYYLPEASLTAFDGQSAFGDWQLEIWDSRAGATNPAPMLLSWQLRLLFENTVPVTGSLGHGQATTNTVPPGGILTYAVVVPAWASYATNTLLFASGPVNLLYNGFAPPTGSGDASFTLLTNSTGGLAVLSANSTPTLIPGETYYLGVQNLTSSNITFALAVDFNVTTLSNAIPVTGWLMDPTLPRYFRFDVSPNATAVAFALTNLTGNADLYVRKGAPLPTAGFRDYASEVPGNDPELVLVFTNSTPVALSPGPWYLGVYNNDTLPVRYTVVAIELTNAIPNIITLTNAVPYPVTAPPVGPATQYYRFDVPVGSQRAQFELDQPSAPLILALQRGFPPLPGLSNFNYQALGTGTSDFWLTVFDYSQPVNLSPGPWFLAVINPNGGAAAYSVMATAWRLPATNLVMTVTSVSTNAFCVSWSTLPGIRYVVQGRASLSVPGWTNVSPVITASNLLTTWCVPLPSPYHFFRIVEAQSASGSPMPAIAGGPQVAAGWTTTGGLTLRWVAPTNQRFRVEWSDTLESPVWTPIPATITSASGAFTFNDTGAETGGLGPRRFYRILVQP
jgi:subtilisin-like proprotein convertase family protein